MTDEPNAPDHRGELIESRMNMERASSIGVSLGGLDTRDMAQVVEYAKGMALSGSMVPAFCRNQVWTCFAICVQALEWKMSPFSLARMSYEVENGRTKERTVAYMSQLTHAVLESRAPLKERLKVRYEGTGDDMVCIVSGTFKGETEAREWMSPRLGDRRPKTVTKNGMHGSYEVTAGSPLWQTKPLVQFFYDTSRDWIRVYCPDVMLGIYSDDEMAEAGFEKAGPPPTDDGGLSTRLSESALARAGFPSDHTINTVDAAMAARDITNSSSVALSDEPNGDAAGSRNPLASPPATDEQPQALDDPAAIPVAETVESRPRASRARRSPPELRQ